MPVEPVTASRAASTGLRRLQAAMVAAGLAAFALMYATQALLPSIGATFDVDAAAASLTVSVTTGVLALTVLPLSALAERLGRTRVMTAGLAVAALSVAAGSAAPDLPLLLLARAVDGLALAGVVAVAMGHLAAELEPAAAGPAIGVYVSGTTLGGLLGRLVPAGIDDLAGWRVALLVLAGVGAACALLFARLVPPTRREAPARPADATDRREHAVRAHLGDGGIVRLCLVGLLLMGGFVATYNYLTYRLEEPPFGLSSGTVGLVFLAYLAGTVSSTLAGRLAVRAGRRAVLLASIVLSLAGLALTLPDALPCVLAGLVIFTAGFFGAHSAASSWVAARAGTATSQASALYLLGYYLGSSIGGWAIGLAWTDGAWVATVLAVAACFLVAAVVGAGVRQPGAGRQSSIGATPGGSKPRIWP